jgi:D-alanyl-D-alanine carboxypeptidase/D-alanyl-D-alanine-endopeptidase (penicillin-binding protein 4)
VTDVIGDDRAFEDDRWSPGMSWNNIPSWPGTAVSALTVDDNEIKLQVIPGAVGAPAQLAVLPYYRIDNRTRTVAADGETKLEFKRLPFSFDLVLTGTIRAGGKVERIRLAIDDPAHYAAWRLWMLLEARGVRVSGKVGARHGPPFLYQAPLERSSAEEAETLARLVPPPLAEDVVRINKESQNLHAELLLRRVGAEAGQPSIEGGLKRVEAMLAKAGVARTAWDLSDGSGMSTYNRLAPRGVVALLRWIAAQPWGNGWKASLPIAATDGTLANRFRGTPLQGRLSAKTGTINASNALSGWMRSKSGKLLVFSFFANDVPEAIRATEAMDAALLLIAQAN